MSNVFGKFFLIVKFDTLTPNAFDYHLTNVIVFRCKNLTISKSKILQKKMNNAISRSPISNEKILLPPLVIFSTGWPISINLQVIFLFSVYGCILCRYFFFSIHILWSCHCTSTSSDSTSWDFKVLFSFLKN